MCVTVCMYVCMCVYVRPFFHLFFLKFGTGPHSILFEKRRNFETSATQSLHMKLYRTGLKPLSRPFFLPKLDF